MCRFLCEHEFSTPLGKNQDTWFLDRMVRVCLVFFKKAAKLFPKWVYHFAFSSAMNESSCCSTSSPACGAVSVLDFGHSNRCVVVSYCCFNSHFPDDIWYGTSFHILICHLSIFFGKLSVKVFGPFFDQVVCFLIVEFLRVLRVFQDFPGGTVVKNPPANSGVTGSSPGPGRSHMPWST